MKRRDFFKKGTLAVSALTVAGITGSSFNDVFAKSKNSRGSFSLEIITDKPGEAQKLSEKFFSNNPIVNSAIKFSEYPVDGEMFGDIVFINNGKLINFRNSPESISKEIGSIAEYLSLPKKLNNPSRLRFSFSENTAAAEKFLIFHKNILIKTIKADGKNSTLNLNGTKGNLTLNIENNKARVISAACTHKTCVNSGSIAFSGESIVCIPNELLIICE